MAQEHKQSAPPYLSDNLFFLRKIVRRMGANGAVASLSPLASQLFQADGYQTTGQRWFAFPKWS
jgi:hypothetical protein